MVKSYTNGNLTPGANQILEIWKRQNQVRNYAPVNNRVNIKTRGCTDGINDGKISFGEKLKNFGKGFISPVKTIFSSPKNLLITGLSVAATAGLITITGGAIAPVMVAAGLIGGSLQIVSGIFKQANAKSDVEAKKAWQNIGSGTFVAGTSVVGGKSALKASGTNTSGMSVWTSVKNCIKGLPKNIVKSASNAASKFSSAYSAAKAVSSAGAGTVTGGSVSSASTAKATSSSSKGAASDSDVIVIDSDDIEIIETKKVKNDYFDSTGEIIDVEYKDIPSESAGAVVSSKQPATDIPKVPIEYFVNGGASNSRLQLDYNALKRLPCNNNIPKDIPIEYFVNNQNNRLTISPEALKHIQNLSNQGITDSAVMTSSSVDAGPKQSLFNKIGSVFKQILKVFGLFKTK